MRIIRLVVALLVMLAAMLPFVTLASESPNTEIKTNINLNSVANFFFPNTAKADETVEAVAAPVVEQAVVKTEEEMAREAVLAKWKEKQAEKWNNLPKGEFVVNASAYTASADECDNNKGITASGLKVQEKRTIACPPEFPFGTKIEIEGQGTFVCEDRGGAIKGNHIDIFVKTKKEAFAFGRQNLNAKVVL
ncbi:MAG: 3D domain-containing protein [Candidatus Moranbacteria bacterium]|nr:3D domain-containing protein [Candidatus Moranbacteria bacterium]